jgi:hypothetical protein
MIILTVLTVIFSGIAALVACKHYCFARQVRQEEIDERLKGRSGLIVKLRKQLETIEFQWKRFEIKWAENKNTPVGMSRDINAFNESLLDASDINELAKLGSYRCGEVETPFSDIKQLLAKYYKEEGSILVDRNVSEDAANSYKCHALRVKNIMNPLKMAIELLEKAPTGY